MSRKFPFVLFICYCVFFAVLSINPYNRAYWVAVNLAPLLIVFLLVRTYSLFRFSNKSYILASFLLFLQTLGSHYFFYRVPFDFFTELFHFNRHNYDRLVHITVGFYAYLIAEYLYRKKTVSADWVVYVVAFAGIMAIAAWYEIFEWLYVATVSPGSNADFLGAQGDIWDAQKDMLSDGVGAVLALLLFYLQKSNRVEESG